MNRAAFQQWIISEMGDNRNELQHCKTAVSTALNCCISEIQRTYIVHYFVDSLTIYQIADIYGVNASSVSRGINRGLKKLFSYLRFATPQLLSVEYGKKDLRKRKVKSTD